MFKIIQGKGFHIKFDNGVTVSVQFGVGNYCEHYVNNRFSQYTTDDLSLPKEKDIWESQNAEIALWDESGGWITKECFDELYNDEIHDDVEGYVEPDKLAEIINWAKNRGNK